MRFAIWGLESSTVFPLGDRVRNSQDRRVVRTSGQKSAGREPGDHVCGAGSWHKAITKPSRSARSTGPAVKAARTFPVIAPKAPATSAWYGAAPAAACRRALAPAGAAAPPPWAAQDWRRMPAQSQCRAGIGGSPSPTRQPPQPPPPATSLGLLHPPGKPPGAACRRPLPNGVDRRPVARCRQLVRQQRPGDARDRLVAGAIGRLGPAAHRCPARADAADGSSPHTPPDLCSPGGCGSRPGQCQFQRLELGMVFGR
jgi:hypothetical protein